MEQMLLKEKIQEQLLLDLIEFKDASNHLLTYHSLKFDDLNQLLTLIENWHLKHSKNIINQIILKFNHKHLKQKEHFKQVIDDVVLAIDKHLSKLSYLIKINQSILVLYQKKFKSLTQDDTLDKLLNKIVNQKKYNDLGKDLKISLNNLKTLLLNNHSANYSLEIVDCYKLLLHKIKLFQDYQSKLNQLI